MRLVVLALFLVMALTLKHVEHKEEVVGVTTVHVMKGHKGEKK